MATAQPTAFRTQEKRFRRFRSEAEALAEPDVVDVRDPVRRARLFDVQQHDGAALAGVVGPGGCAALTQATVFASTVRPGVLFIPNPFSAKEQSVWVQRAVRDYSRLANPSNLDPHYRFPENTDARWHVGQRCSCQVGRGLDCHAAFAKLRWVTLGWHYDWTAKVYPPGRVGVFPDDLATLMGAVAAHAHLHDNANDPVQLRDDADEPAHPQDDANERAHLRDNANAHAHLHDDLDKRTESNKRHRGPDGRASSTASWIAPSQRYRAEAAIVNYYHPGDTLAGHNDHSEEDHTAPLISVSFGLSAIFLLGGLDRDEKPTAIVLRSGDILIMRDQARLSFHGVPAVFANSTPPALLDELCAADQADIGDYVRHARINLNVRQVFCAPASSSAASTPAAVAS